MTREPFNPFLIEPSAAEKAQTGPTKEKPWTVSQLTSRVKDALEAVLPGTIHVLGETSNVKHHGSGHVYFTLKDDQSELGCVMWRSDAAKLKFDLRDGLETIATGNIGVFERTGRYQLYVRRIEPRGVGELELAFRQLTEKLQKAGLFEDRHKKPLPAFPQRIAVVTSPTGAAIGDICRTLKRRYPAADVLLWPVRVQGQGAAPEIRRAIERVNELAASLEGIDLMIVGRGGGSLEDLWAFNEEAVARAIFASDIPVISAVGHEYDLSIADMVADIRAATPTAAAELAVPLLQDVLGDLNERRSGMLRALRSQLDLADAGLRAVQGRRWFREPLTKIRRREQLLDEWMARRHAHLLHGLQRSRQRLSRVEAALERIAPHAVLLQRERELARVARELRRAMRTRLVDATAEWQSHGDRLRESALPPTLARHGEHVAALRHRLRFGMNAGLRATDARLQALAQQLTALSYKSILHRGYSITRDKKTGDVIRTPDALRDGTRITTETQDGTFESEVLNLKQMELFD